MPSKSIREAVQTQCEEDPDIGYPEFGVTNSISSKPVLKTHRMCSCVGIAIYSRSTTDTLLGHFTTEGYYGEKVSLPKDLAFDSSDFFNYKSNFPLEWYVGAFKSEYFNNPAQSPLEVTIISNSITPRRAVDALIDSARHYFPNATIMYANNAEGVGNCTDFELDSTTGIIDYKAVSCVAELGCYYSNDPQKMDISLIQREGS